MNKFPFIAGMTWSKAGFLFLSNSLAYKDVLEVNTGWDITASPAVGTLLNQPDGYVGGGLNSTYGNNTVRNYPGDNSFTYYPFNSKEEYLKALARYPPSALRKLESCNGWSLTSKDVIYQN